MGMTMSEKILARASGLKEVKAGDIVDAEIDQAMTHCSGGPIFFKQLEILNPKKIKALDKLIVIIGHTMPPIVGRATGQDIIRKNVYKYKIEHNFYETRYGVMHNVMMWKGHVRPGELFVATDSHTPTMGALGAFAIGIGPTELAYTITFGKVWLRVPETIRIVLTGQLKKHVSAKDIALYLTGNYGTELAQYKTLEFAGPLAESLSLDGRTTLCAMGTELGAKAVMFPPNEKTIQYVKERTNKPFTPIYSDPDAAFLQTIEINADLLEPLIACPHDPGNVKPISELEGTVIHQATIGTCTNGGFEDLEIAAQILKNRKIHPRVRLYIIPNTMEVYMRAMQAGLFQILIEAGGVITNPQCGFCSGHIGILVPGDVCLAAQNRNFKGRMGSPDAEIYLSSPATVAASAIEGKMTNPRKYLG
jgi:3-isopropylmalate/(R)-2-methylmalate dehydratase large subunit